VNGLIPIIGFWLEKVREFLRIKFVKDTLFLQTGGLLARVVAVPFSIILARLLHPEGLGLYHLSFAVLGLIGVIGNLGVTDAGINRLATAYAIRDTEETKDILSFILKMFLIMTAVVFTVGMIIAPYISKAMYQNTEIGLFVRVLLLTMPLGILFLLSNIIFQSTRNMKTLVISENLRGLITPVIVVTAVLLGFGIMGAVSGNVIATAIGALLASILYFRLRSSNPALPSFREMVFNKLSRAKFKRYFSFSFLIAIDKNIVRFYPLLPVLFLGMFFPPQEVGYFRIALGVVTIPTIVVQAISRNMSVKVPEAYATNGISGMKSVIYKITKFSIMLSIVSTVLILIVMPYVIRFLYGSEYTPSINIAYVLAIHAAFNGAGVGFYIFRTLDKLKYPIFCNLATLALVSPIGIMLIQSMGGLGAAIYMVCLYVVSIALGLIFLKKLTG